MIVRRQAIAAGLTSDDVARLIRRREWARVHPGVYVDHTGPLPWSQRAWAAVLAVDRHRKVVAPTACRSTAWWACRSGPCGTSARRGCATRRPRSTWRWTPGATSRRWRCWRRSVSRGARRRAGCWPWCLLGIVCLGAPGRRACCPTWQTGLARCSSTGTSPGSSGLTACRGRGTRYGTCHRRVSSIAMSTTASSSWSSTGASSTTRRHIVIGTSSETSTLRSTGGARCDSPTDRSCTDPAPRRAGSARC